MSRVRLLPVQAVRLTPFHLLTLRPDRSIARQSSVKALLSARVGVQETSSLELESEENRGGRRGELRDDVDNWKDPHAFQDTAWGSS